MNTSYVTSADGTRIAFERKGNGPAVILVDGALCSREIGPMKSVANLLAQNFSVIQYDRRGRNESGDASQYSVDREIEDIEALAKEAGEQPFVLGISSGAVLIVRAAAQGVKFKKIALFEPPILLQKSLNENTAADHGARLKEFIAAGKESDAVKYFLKTMVGVPGPIVAVMRILPMWSKLKALSKTLPYDAEITREGSLSANQVASINTPIAVIWGEKSAPFLKNTSQQFAKVLPNVIGEELKGQTHAASGKALVPVLNKFFSPG
jgi:pimeloyl-ACP methyl ester carboxylesterase